MKKVFVSMPMRGKGKEEIAKEQERVLKLALGVLGIEGELAKSYFLSREYTPYVYVYILNATV